MAVDGTADNGDEDDDRFRELETNGKRFWTVMHSIRWLLEGTEIRRAMDRELERLRGNGTFDQLIDSALTSDVRDAFLRNESDTE